MPRKPRPTAAPPAVDPASGWDEVLSAFGPHPTPRPPPAAPADDQHTADGPLAGARAALGRLSSWVPIRSLTRSHRRRIVEHLMTLDARDRYLRFGYAASDEQIHKYASGIDFSRDEVLGIFNRQLQLVALAHLAYGQPVPGDPTRTMAEFGVSVLQASRGQGLGRRLFETAGLHARNRGIDTLFIHALSENRPMLSIATAAGAVVERDGGESAAYLRLPPESFGSQVEQALERHLGELDFQFKRQAQVIGEFVDGVAEVKAHFDASGRAAKE